MIKRVERIKNKDHKYDVKKDNEMHENDTLNLYCFLFSVYLVPLPSEQKFRFLK